MKEIIDEKNAYIQYLKFIVNKLESSLKKYENQPLITRQTTQYGIENFNSEVKFQAAEDLFLIQKHIDKLAIKDIDFDIKHLLSKEFDLMKVMIIPHHGDFK